MNIHDDSYTKGMMLSDLDNHKVAMVTIKPNEATPTGAVYVTLKTGDEKSFYSTDVITLEQTIREKYDLDVRVENVPQENWFLSNILPILIL